MTRRQPKSCVEDSRQALVMPANNNGASGTSPMRERRFIRSRALALFTKSLVLLFACKSETVEQTGSDDA